MLTTSRKRINSVKVSQLISEIKQMARSDSLYNKLNSYDHVIKKYKIDPLDLTALEIYEYLIEQQTLPSLPTNSRIQMDSFKFSRNQINVLDDQEAQFSQQIKDVQDPELHNGKLFSFAKNHRNQSKNINQHDLKPKQLFNSINMKEKQKSKSDNKTSKNSIFYVNQPYSQLFCEDQSQKLNVSRKKSVNTISHLSNSESESHLMSKEAIFNSQKTKKIPHHQEITPKYLLNLHLKNTYFHQFLSLVELDKIKIQQSSQQKRIKYFYCRRLLKLSFKGLLKNLLIERQNQRKASEFHKLKSQYLVEEYFVEWKEFTQLSEEAKQRHQQIDQKFAHLSSFLLINNLKLNLTQIQSGKQKLKKQKQMVKIKQQFLHKTLFFMSFSSKFNSILKQRANTNQIDKFIAINQSTYFIAKLNQFFKNQQVQESHQIQKCIIKVKGKTFIESLKDEQNFNEVYWKSKQNPKKLIFLNYLLTALKSSFQRLGYQYSWMPKLQQNINITDKKLSRVLSNDIKLRAFKRLALFTQTQKQDKHKIKVMLMDNFLKCLAFSSYVQCRKKADSLKTQTVQQYLYLNNGQNFIEFLDHRVQKNLQQKQKTLKKYLQQKKCQQFLIYLESYLRSKQFYSDKIKEFKERSRLRLMSQIWLTFKRVLKGQIINNKLVKEYLNLKNKIIAERCFGTLKDNIFEQKLFRKKQQNLTKLIKLRSFTSFCSKLKENYNYEPKTKEETMNKFTEQFRTERKGQFFEKWKNSIKQKSLKQRIEQYLTTNYESHLMTKCFNVMKFVTVKTKQESMLSKQIREIHCLRIKEQYFQRLLEALVQRKSVVKLIDAIQDCAAILQAELIQDAFGKIKNCSQQ